VSTAEKEALDVWSWSYVVSSERHFHAERFGNSRFPKEYSR
jgi:hypothetical protein